MTLRPWYKNAMALASAGVVVALAVLGLNAAQPEAMGEAAWGFANFVTGLLMGTALAKCFELEEKRLELEKLHAAADAPVPPVLRDAVAAD